MHEHQLVSERVKGSLVFELTCEEVSDIRLFHRNLCLTVPNHLLPAPPGVSLVLYHTRSPTSASSGKPGNRIQCKLADAIAVTDGTRTRFYFDGRMAWVRVA